MENWKERVIIEKKELDLKIYNLELFLNSDKAKNIDSKQLGLLNIQLYTMKTYSNCLNERLS